MVATIDKGMNPVERAQAMDLSRALLTLRSVDPKISAEEAFFLLAVAARPGISQTEIKEELDLRPNQVSRIFGRLSVRGDQSGTGLKLVRTEDSPEDYRKNLNYLTHAGEVLVRAVLQEVFPALKGGPIDDSQTEG